MRKIITVSLVLGLATALMAKPNVPIGDMKANLAKMAGEKSIFASHEVFPKDYFLIPKNLPFLAGLTLHHPMSSTLELTKEQIEKIQTIKGDTMPVVIKDALEIKALELKLHGLIDKEVKDEELNAAIDKIGALKIALTKKHLVCIKSIRDILTPPQRKKLEAYAGKKMKKKGDNHPVKELLPLPHPVKIIMQNEEELKITKEQNEKIEKQMHSVFPEKIHGGMDKAKVIEDKIQKAVLKEGKTKEDLKADIKALSDIKVEITNDHIDALNVLAKILSKEQFVKVLELSKKSHKH